MAKADELTKSIAESDEQFKETFRKILKELKISVKEFSKISKIPKSTLYKIFTEKREPNLKTVRIIINTIKEIEGYGKGDFIAVVATRPVLNEIEKTIIVDNKTITIREYPANSMEEAIISSIKAERDGALALVCAPIISPTVEKILTIPIVTMMPKDSVIEAIKVAGRKVL